mgnify:CR=1 FL=1
MKLPEIQAVCRTMAKEMYHAGVIEEAVDEAMAMADPEDLEQQADETVDNVLFDVLQDVTATLAPGPLKTRYALYPIPNKTKQNHIVVGALNNCDLT